MPKRIPRSASANPSTAHELVNVASLKARQGNARTHSQLQIRQIAQSIKTFGFLVPLVIDDANTIWLGHGRFEASKLLGLTAVPVVRLGGLSETKKRALAIAENKIGGNGGWDRKILAFELPELSDLLIREELDISITGFTPIEIDQLAIDFESDSADPLDAVDQRAVTKGPIAIVGDIWQLGSHQLLCGDARDLEAIKRLLGARYATMAFLDPPYNVSIRKTVGRGRSKHDEFAMASGEMRRPEFVRFLKEAFHAACAVSHDGAVHFNCCDWRHVSETIEAASSVYGAMINLAVWVKSNAGLGSFYRSQHELVGIFRVGRGPHLNNIELGRHGRSRTNVWHYAGVNSFRAGRLEDLRSHPTIKPVAMVSDAIKDCTPARRHHHRYLLRFGDNDLSRRASRPPRCRR